MRMMTLTYCYHYTNTHIPSEYKSKNCECCGISTVIRYAPLVYQNPNKVFWNVTLCSLTHGQQTFRSASTLQLQVNSSTMKMRAAGSPEIDIHLQNSIVPQVRRLQSWHCCKQRYTYLQCWLPMQLNFARWHLIFSALITVCLSPPPHSTKICHFTCIKQKHQVNP
jgi:hypothetical protein